MRMRKVILESPYAGDVLTNLVYAEDCLRDSLMRGEAPLASHLLYTQVLDDGSPSDRDLGIAAGHAWLSCAEAVVVYLDRGVSPGMKLALGLAEKLGIPVEYRSLP